MITWRLERGPLHGQTRRAWAGVELIVPVLTPRDGVIDMIYTAMRVAPDVIWAEYEGYRSRE